MSNDSLPLQLTILTADFEIRGTVYVSRRVKEDRRITELLNAGERRFLAVTDAEVLPRQQPGSARRYSFMQLHIDTIQMVHPSTQSLLRENAYSVQESERFETLRQRLSRV
jgi:hypothetical protein